MKTITAAAVAALALSNSVAIAHHGGSMYDRADQLILEDAVVVEFLFVNPHARLIFSWTNSDGTVTEWEGELSGSTELVRSGIYTNLVAPGQRVTVKGYGHRTDARNMRVSAIVFADGREVALP